MASLPAVIRLTPSQQLRKLKADVRVENFHAFLTRHGLPLPVAEFRFHPPRRWRFDFCWPQFSVALENQGGIFSGGRHTRGAALLREHEKLNNAAADGWRVLFTTPQTICSPATLTILRIVLGRPA